MKKRMAKLVAVVLATTMLMTACTTTQEEKKNEKEPVYTKYQVQFLGAFDTVIQLMGYTQTKEEFEVYAKQGQDRFTELNELFDRFDSYEGVNNIKTINDNAGITPVVVDPIIIDLIEFSIEWYDHTDGKINIAMGPVLEIWHGYMAQYSNNPEGAKLPPMEELEQAASLANIEDIIIDHQASTVFLKEKGMMIDVGAIAKGYATEMVATELATTGLDSLLLSAGGNVVAKNPPKDSSRDSWNIGIKNPFIDVEDPQSGSVNIVSLNNIAVVSSGDYERFYMVEDERVHHIIDPETLMPASHYRGVTVVTQDSGKADALSTALFTMDYEDSRAFAEKNDLAVMWIMPDGTIQYTQQMEPLVARPDIAHVNEFMKLYE